MKNARRPLLFALPHNKYDIVNEKELWNDTFSAIPFTCVETILLEIVSYFKICDPICDYCQTSLHMNLFS